MISLVTLLTARALYGEPAVAAAVAVAGSEKITYVNFSTVMHVEIQLNFNMLSSAYVIVQSIGICACALGTFIASTAKAILTFSPMCLGVSFVIATYLMQIL